MYAERDTRRLAWKLAGEEEDQGDEDNGVVSLSTFGTRPPPGRKPGLFPRALVVDVANSPAWEAIGPAPRRSKKHSRRRSSPPPPRPTPSSEPTREFLGNLSSFLSDTELGDQLGAAFEEIGVRVEDFAFRQSDPSKYAFATFESRQALEKVIKTYNGRLFNGQPIVINFERGRGPASQTKAFPLPSRPPSFPPPSSFGSPISTFYPTSASPPPRSADYARSTENAPPPAPSIHPSRLEMLAKEGVREGENVSERWGGRRGEWEGRARCRKEGVRIRDGG